MLVGHTLKGRSTLFLALIAYLMVEFCGKQSQGCLYKGYTQRVVPFYTFSVNFDNNKIEKYKFLIVTMVKSFDCSKCGGHHPRPINRNCKLVQETDQEEEMDTNVLILKELKTLNSRMTEMESKVQALDAVRLPSTSSSSRRSRKDSETDMVLPSLEGLRSSREIQDQVDARIKDLQNS